MNQFQTGLVVLGICAAATSLGAVPLSALETCYRHDFSDYALEQNPEINVKAISLSLDATGASVTLTGTNHDGQFGYLRFSCYGQTGSETSDPSCSTFERESALTLTQRANGDIIVMTTNGFLSNVGNLYGYEDNEAHYAFYIEADRDVFSGPIGQGPKSQNILSPASPDACPIVPD